MDIRNTARGAWFALVAGLLVGLTGAVGMASAESTKPSPAANASKAKVSIAGKAEGDSGLPLVARAATPEAKAKYQKHAREMKAIRTSAQRMDLDYVRAAREREQARLEAEKAGRTRTDVPSEAKKEKPTSPQPAASPQK